MNQRNSRGTTSTLLRAALVALLGLSSTACQPGGALQGPLAGATNGSLLGSLSKGGPTGLFRSQTNSSITGNRSSTSNPLSNQKVTSGSGQEGTGKAGTTTGGAPRSDWPGGKAQADAWGRVSAAQDALNAARALPTGSRPNNKARAQQITAAEKARDSAFSDYQRQTQANPDWNVGF